MSLVGQVAKGMLQISSLDDVQSWATSALRGARGLIVTPHNRDNPPRPDRPLEMYEFEACPYCRKVREVMTELDLRYISRVCPKGTARNRHDLRERGGKQQVPYLVDPNAGVEMYESEEIITYLVDTYGPGRTWSGKFLAPLNTASAIAASMIRPRGRRGRPGITERVQPEELLVLYNMEASPYCRKVREVLVELDLDHLVENVGKGSQRRGELAARGGKVMVPFLIDPNEDIGLYESDDIVAYLEGTYGSQAT